MVLLSFIVPFFEDLGEECVGFYACVHDQTCKTYLCSQQCQGQQLRVLGTFSCLAWKHELMRFRKLFSKPSVYSQFDFLSVYCFGQVI